MSYQLPVESSSSKHTLLADHPPVMLCLCSYAQALHDLTQIDEVHELNCGVVTKVEERERERADEGKKQGQDGN